jgi:putative ABC transport system ATP-binding protein
MTDTRHLAPAASVQALIELDGVGFAWPRQAELLDIPAFRLERGERLFLRGPSGSGKTTLLGLLGGVQRAGRGQVRLLGADLGAMSASARDRFRVDHTGYIFQQFNLLPFLSVRENVELPCRFSRVRRERAGQRHGGVGEAARELLGHLGLPAALHGRRAGELSIGQQQRVAAARALIGQPELVIADEPTSALDADTRQSFIELLFAECAAADASLLFVSHDQSLAPLFDRSLSLADINRAARPAEN